VIPQGNAARATRTLPFSAEDGELRTEQ